MYDRPMFKKIKQIFEERVASTTAEYHKLIASSDTCLDASKILGANFNLTIEATTGNITLGYSTSITSTQGYILTEGTSIDLKVPSAIYFCSASTTARFQAIAWDN
jgi:hypothetical protein